MHDLKVVRFHAPRTSCVRSARAPRARLHPLHVPYLLLIDGAERLGRHRGTAVQIRTLAGGASACAPRAPAYAAREATRATRAASARPPRVRTERVHGSP